jgi:protein transport protein SEC61 subunit gamma-like protein
MEEGKPGIKSRMSSFLVQCKRVWLILKKPSSEEFKGIAKVSALGILILGALGFLIADIVTFISRTFG